MTISCIQTSHFTCRLKSPSTPTRGIANNCRAISHPTLDHGHKRGVSYEEILSLLCSWDTMSRFRLSPQALLVREQVLRNRCGTYFSHRHYAGRVATPIVPTDQSAERWPNGRKLTREEKDKMEAMLAEDHCWDSIANALPGRTQRTLMDHYRDYMFTPGELIKTRPSAEKITLPETHWSLEGDRKILDMLAEKQSWHIIAETLPSRTAQSIERRYGQGLCKLEKPRDADAKPRGFHSKPSSVERSQQPLDRRSPLDAQARRNFTTIHCRVVRSQVATLLPHDPLPVGSGRSWS